MEVAKPLLVIISSDKISISVVKSAVMVLTDLIAILSTSSSGIIEAVVGDLFDCIEHLLKTKTSVATYRAVLLLRVVLGTVDLLPSFSAKHKPHVNQVSQSVQQQFAALHNLLSIVKKKIPLSNIQTLLMKEDHPIAAVLLLQLLQFLIGSTPKKIDSDISRAIARSISNQCNQPEIHGVLLTMLMGNGRADLERPDFQPGPNDDLTGLQTALLPIIFQFLTRGYQISHSDALTHPICMSSYLEGESRRACDKWLKIISKVRMLIILRKHFGLPSPKSMDSKTPPPGLSAASHELHLVGKQLCEASLRSIKGCLQYPKWVQVFQKDDFSVFLAVDLSFGVLGKSGGLNDEVLPTMVSMISDDIINDFVLVEGGMLLIIIVKGLSISV